MVFGVFGVAAESRLSVYSVVNSRGRNLPRKGIESAAEIWYNMGCFEIEKVFMKMRIYQKLMMVCVVFAAHVVCAVGMRQKIIQEGEYRWQLMVDEEDCATIIGCVEASTGSKDIDGSLVVPCEIGGYRVIGIGDGVFMSRQNLRGVVISEGVEEIGTNVFANCIGLEAVTIPSTVREIRAGTFMNCSLLGSMVVPNTVTNLGVGVFQGCTLLSSVTLSKNLTEISSNLFSACVGLCGVKIPEGVTNIEYGAFYGCWGLRGVEIPSSVLKIGEQAFAGCSGMTRLDLVEDLEEIGTNAFRGCVGLGAVVLPRTMRRIARGAFTGCQGLKSVTYGTGEVEIGENAFSGCMNLERMVLEDGVTLISSNMFYACTGLKAVEIPETVKSIGAEAFHYCEALESVTIPSGVTNIGENAFCGCKGLKSVKVPGGVKELASGVFSYCDRLEAVTLEEGLLEIGGSVFERTPVKEITIPSTVTNIEATAFSATTDLPVMATSSIELEKVYFRGKPPLISGEEFAVTNLTAAPFGMAANGYYARKYAEEWKEALGGDEEGAWFGLMMAMDVREQAGEGGGESAAENEVVAMLKGSAQVYNAVICDAAGELVGTMQLKAGKVNVRTGRARVVLTVAMAGARKKVYRGEIDADGKVTIAGFGDGDFELTVDGLRGEYMEAGEEYYFAGARDLFASKEREDKRAAKEALGVLQAVGPWGIAWEDDESGAWNGVTLVVGAKGRVKVAGVLVDGTKVTSSVQGILSEDEWVVPVAIVKKNYALKFVVEFRLDGAVKGVSGLGDGVEAGPVVGIGEGVMSVDVARMVEMASAADLVWDWGRVPDGMELGVAGTKWILPRENVAKVRLGYRAKSGSVSGSFKVYEWAKGKWKTRTMSVWGVVVNGKVLGAVQMKKVGAAAMKIE